MTIASPNIILSDWDISIILSSLKFALAGFYHVLRFPRITISSPAFGFRRKALSYVHLNVLTSQSKYCLVRGEGLEPSRDFSHKILSLMRMPNSAILALVRERGIEPLRVLPH